MKLKLTVAGLAAAISLAAGAASAATVISISTFDIGAFNGKTSGLGKISTIEDFETGYTAGILSGPLSTSVGTFDTAGGTGNGSTCQASLGNPNPAGTCSELAIFDKPINGQGSLVPVGGKWSLNSNDTSGILWTATRGGSEFNRLVFGMTDAADQTAFLRVRAGGTTVTQTLKLANGNERLVVIDFSTFFTSADVQILGTVNDALAIDGAAAVNVVPVPAAGLMLLGGLGALAAVRRKKKAA